MSRYYGIGDAGRKLHAKLVGRLAGPLEALLPIERIDRTLRAIG